MAWDDTTVLESARGDLVPQLAAIGMDARVTEIVAASGGALRARQLLNGVNDWLSAQRVPGITMPTLERYVTERVAAGALSALAEQGAPLTARLAAPSPAGVQGTNIAWANVTGAVKWYAIGRFGQTIKRIEFNVRTVPIATAAKWLGAQPGETFTIQVAARAADGTLGWFTAPISASVAVSPEVP